MKLLAVIHRENVTLWAETYAGRIFCEKRNSQYFGINFRDSKKKVLELCSLRRSKMPSLQDRKCANFLLGGQSKTFTEKFAYPCSIMQNCTKEC